MVDPPMFHVFKPMSELVPYVIRQINEGDLTDDECLIFNPAVLGYSFALKLWGECFFVIIEYCLGAHRVIVTRRFCPR